MSLTLNYTNKIYPDAEQVAKLLESLKICCGASSYPLQKIKGLINSRHYHVGYGCVKSEYILIVKAALSGYYRQRKELFQTKKRLTKLAEVPYKVWQINSLWLRNAWEYHKNRGLDLPHLKKYGKLQSLWVLQFPQFETNAITGYSAVPFDPANAKKLEHDQNVADTWMI